MRMRFSILVTTLLLVAVLPAAVFAGGWSVVSLDSLPSDVGAGQEITVGFTVLQHGKTPMVGLRPKPVVGLEHPASGQRITATASEEGPAGHYVARFTLPQGGTWQWQITAFEGAHGMPPLEVKPTVASATPATPATQPATWRWPLLALAAVLAVLAALNLAYDRRWRRPALGTARPEQGQA